MADVSWPSPNHGTPARAVTDSEYGHLAPWASDGVFQSATDVVYANSSGMQVFVRAGKRALVQVHAWYSGSTDLALTIAANSSGSARTDTVVLRLDRSTWDVRAAVRQGTPGAGAPTLQRDTGDTGLWEIPLADIVVDNAAASIASAKVTNRPLLQSGATRACNVLTDIQATLAPGDMVYESSTGRWIGWTSAGPVVLYEDTGWTSISATGNWKSGDLLNRVRRVGSVVCLTGAFIRTNAHLVPGSAASPLGTLPTSYAPTLQQHNWMAWTTTGGARVRANTDGRLEVVAVTGTIDVNSAVYFDTTWMVG